MQVANIKQWFIIFSEDEENYVQNGENARFVHTICLKTKLIKLKLLKNYVQNPFFLGIVHNLLLKNKQVSV